MSEHRNYTKIAKQYALDIVSGKIPACKWTKLACQRQLDDLAREANDPTWPYEFNKKTKNEKVGPADKICAFIENLSHVKGIWAKRKERIILGGWQIFILTTVFGWRDKKTKCRRFKTAYNEMARKNGKSTISAPIGIYMMCADGEAGAEVYSGATKAEQAKVAVWDPAKLMVDWSPDLQEAYGVETSAHSIYQEESASFFKTISSEYKKLDALNVHCGIIDELHAHKKRDVFDVIETARGARTQPLLWLITTAGSDRSGICYEQRIYVTKILERVIFDESYFGIIYSIDEAHKENGIEIPGDDWKDEKNWIKANPNLEISVNLDQMRDEARKAARMPSALNNFLTKRLSVWVNADVALFDIAKWSSLGNSDLKEDDFKSERCYCAVDLAPRHDFCDTVKMFYRDIDDITHYYVFAKHRLSEGEVENSNNAQFKGWESSGWIVTNPGETTDYDAIEDDLREIAASYEIAEVAYDPFQAKQLADHMVAESFPMIELRMTVQNLSEATKKLDALIAEGRIHHSGDPVLTWMMSNVVGHYDRKDNVYPVKGRPENKIDGAIALIMILSRIILSEPKQSSSVYDERGIVFL